MCYDAHLTIALTEKNVHWMLQNICLTMQKFYLACLRHLTGLVKSWTANSEGGGIGLLAGRGSRNRNLGWGEGEMPGRCQGLDRQTDRHGGNRKVEHTEWKKSKKPKAKHSWTETGKIKLKELVGQV